MSEKFYRYRALQPSVWSLVFVDFRPTIHPSEETIPVTLYRFHDKKLNRQKVRILVGIVRVTTLSFKLTRKKTEEKRKINNKSIVGENHEVYVRQKYGKKWYAKYVAIRRQ